MNKEKLKKAQKRGERVHKKMGETITRIHDGYGVIEDQEPVKQKDTLYDLLGDFLQYSDHKETVCKIVRDWLDQNTTIVEEDYSTVTLKLRKGAFGDAN